MTKKGEMSDRSWIAVSRAYWIQRIDECDMGCDWDEAHKRCWRCGMKRALQKCHIIPKSLGGKSSGENLIPLCSECHDEAPDVLDSTAMWSWIKRTHSTFHGTLKADRAIKLALELGANPELFDSERLRELLRTSSGVHFGQNGQGAYTKIETMAWAIVESCRPRPSLPFSSSADESSPEPKR